MPPPSRPRSTKPDSITVGSIRFGFRLSSEGGRLPCSPAYLEDVIDDALPPRPAVLFRSKPLALTSTNAVPFRPAPAASSANRTFRQWPNRDDVPADVERGYRVGLHRRGKRSRSWRGAVDASASGAGTERSYGPLVSCRAWLGTHTLEPVRPDPLLRGRPRILVDRRAARRRPLASLQRAPFAAGARRRSRSKLVTAGAGGAECARSASTRSPGTFGCWLRAPLNDADALLRLLC